MKKEELKKMLCDWIDDHVYEGFEVEGHMKTVFSKGRKRIQDQFNFGVLKIE